MNVVIAGEQPLAEDLLQLCTAAGHATTCATPGRMSPMQPGHR